MCVIVAAKVYLKNSNIDKWFFFKNRDRAYPPHYQVHYKNFKGISTVFVTDDDNDWTEGVNDHGLMIVNTALQNYDDKKDDGEVGDLPAYDSGQGKILRTAFTKKSVNEAVKVLVDGLFDGCTFVSDGDKLTAVEIFLKREVDERIMAELAKSMNLDIKANRREIRRNLWDKVSKSDYDIVVKEIKDDDFIVRTNHGEFIKDAGYIKIDGDGWVSSKKRREYTEKALKEISPVTHPFQILTMMKNLGADEIDKEPQNRPLRIAPKGYNFDTAEHPIYFTSTINMLTPTGQLYILPVNCTFEDYKTSRMTKERNVYFVLLPKNLPLFENRHLFKEEDVVEMDDIKKTLAKIQIKEMKLVDRYLKKETTDTGDIALPPDKASTKTKAGQASKKRKKKKLLIDEPAVNAAKKKGGSS